MCKLFHFSTNVLRPRCCEAVMLRLTWRCDCDLLPHNKSRQFPQMGAKMILMSSQYSTWNISYRFIYTNIVKLRSRSQVRSRRSKDKGQRPGPGLYMTSKWLQTITVWLLTMSHWYQHSRWHSGWHSGWHLRDYFHIFQTVSQIN